MTYTISALPFEFNALEPLMDAKTVEIHYTKHHQGYVNNLNTLLEKSTDLSSKSIVWLLQNLSSVPEEIRTPVKNNAGGTINHDLFWEILTPGGKKLPEGKLLEAIMADFESFENFKTKLLEIANKHFASGWAFLYLTADKKLAITSYPGHETPLMEDLTPLLTIDVWEHAYYLKHQNLRADFTKSLFELFNWDIIEKKYLESINLP